MNDVPKNLCIIPWVHLANRAAGSFRPCCNTTIEVPKDDQQDVYRYDNCNVEEYWNSSYMRELRNQFLNNEQPEICSKCWDNEAAGITSMRQSKFDYWYHDLGLESEINDTIEYSKINDGHVNIQPMFLDLKLGNLCNLKCRMCDQTSSNQFIKDMDEVASIPHLAKFKANKTDQWYNTKQVWDNLYHLAPNIKFMYSTGGEPTLNNNLLKFAEYCIEHGYTKDMSMHITTNLTNINLMKIMEQFKQSVVTVSIDGTEDLLEYIRFPIKWNKFDNNLKELNNFKNAYISFTMAYQVYNILNIVDITEYILKHSTDIVYNTLIGPEYFNVRILPDNVKKVAEDRIRNYLKRTTVPDAIRQDLLGVINYMNSPIPNRDELQKEFMEVTKSFNKHRKQSNDALDDVLQEWIDNG